MKNLQFIKGAKKEMSLYVIWNRTNHHNWKRLFVGTLEECKKEFNDCEYDDVNETIEPNNIVDQFEPGMAGHNQITFGTGTTIFY